MSTGSTRFDAIVDEVVEVNDLIKRFRFVRADGKPVPPFSGGSHVVIEMIDQDGVRRLNPYSLMSDPADTTGYAISVRRDDGGRGGSLHMHRRVTQGMAMSVSYPVNLFPLDGRAKKHLLIAGGIGITPFIAQMSQLSQQNASFELHYSTRSRELGAYAEELREHYGPRVHLYYKDFGEEMDLSVLLHNQPLGTHLYVCGPKGMIAWVLDTAKAQGWPEGSLHSEEFLAPPVGEPFDVRLATSGLDIRVGPTQSLLEAIEMAGVEAPYLCRGGACGQCETAVLECDGTLHHNDHWLTDEQKASGQMIMPCVSRFTGKKLVLDR